MYVGMLSGWVFNFLLILAYFPLSYRDKFGISGKVLMRPLYFKDRNSRFQR